MLTIKCTLNGIPYETSLFQYVGKDETPDDVREIANDIWDSMKKNPHVKELRGYAPDGTVWMPAKEKEMTWGVWGYFNVTKEGKPGKLYPFECDNRLHENERFLAMPNGVPTVATVFACRWVERQKVVAACNGHKLFKIKDTVRSVYEKDLEEAYSESILSTIGSDKPLEEELADKMQDWAIRNGKSISRKMIVEYIK